MYTVYVVNVETIMNMEYDVKNQEKGRIFYFIILHE